jgi:hypothetical protein
MCLLLLLYDSVAKAYYFCLSPSTVGFDKIISLLNRIQHWIAILKQDHLTII